MEIKNMNNDPTNRWPFTDEPVKASCGNCDQQFIDNYVCDCGWPLPPSSIKWDMRFLHLAREVASWSKDPSTQTGAVLVRPDRTVCSLGFNGFPRRMNDAPHLYNDREVKYKRIIHCEINALLSSRDQDHQGYTLYVWPFGPCERCAVQLIQAGITRVVCPRVRPDAKTLENVKLGHEFCKEAGLQYTIYG